MALTDPYVDLETFKTRIGSESTDSDAAIVAIIDAASRQIDGWTGRTFAKADADVVRYFSARCYDRIRIGDFVSVTELAMDHSGGRTYDTIWLTDDYDLYPYDAAELGRPYTEVRLSTLSTRSLPVYPKAVRVTGIFGWPRVPDAIREATFLQANRLFGRTKAPFGVTGAPNELGQLTAISSLDPDVRTMIAPYRVMPV